MAEIKQYVAEICERVGPRASGSEAEARAAELVRGQLSSWGLQPEVEPFEVRPRAFHLFIAFSAAAYVVALGLYFLWPPAALGLLALTWLQAFVQLSGAGNLLAPLLGKRPSQNVVARLAPADGPPRRVLVFSGHHDSAFHMPLLARRTHRLVFVMFPLFLLSAALLLALSGWDSWALLTGGPGSPGTQAQRLVLGICGLGAVCAVALPLGMIRTGVVMGANDNLTGVAVTLALARRFALRAPPRRTELWFVSFGSEEAGMVGSRDFVRRHRRELEGARLINIDGVGQPGTLRVLAGELMSFSAFSRQVVRLIQDAAAEAGHPIRRQWLPAGMTDASSFSRKGLSASSILRLDAQGYLEHYHTPGDVLATVREENLQQVFDICRRIVERVDGEPG
jgi:hypothetical protein